MGPFSGCDMVKIATLFLILMLILAMFGRLKIPKLFKRSRTKLPGTEKCTKCGALKISGTDCACGDKAKK